MSKNKIDLIIKEPKVKGLALPVQPAPLEMRTKPNTNSSTQSNSSDSNKDK